ncbi:hypothetical protein [Acetobacter tropicalis]
MEQFFARLKQLRGIATRYDMLKSTFLTAVHFFATMLALN